MNKSESLIDLMEKINNPVTTVPEIMEFIKNIEERRKKLDPSKFHFVAKKD